MNSAIPRYLLLWRNTVLTFYTVFKPMNTPGQQLRKILNAAFNVWNTKRRQQGSGRERSSQCLVLVLLRVETLSKQLKDTILWFSEVQLIANATPESFAETYKA